MSKFIDKLNQVSQAVPHSLGFGAVQPVSQRLKMVLVASLAQSNIDDLTDYVVGADAVLLRISESGLEAKTLQKVLRVVPDISWGGWLEDSSQGEIEKITKAGSDFVVFSAANTPVTILQEDEVGKILEVEASLSEGLLRTVDELPVDAVLITGEQEGEYFLTWHHLMLFQRFAHMLSKPLLASVPANVTANELQILWRVGVTGVVVEVKLGQPAEKLRELRQEIDKLTFSPQRRVGKVEALIPHISEETDTMPEEEEE